MITFIYFQLRTVVRILMRLLFSLECDGLHYIDEQPGAVILAGNHTGWLDALIVCVACKRRVRFLVADWVLKLPVIGIVIRIFGGIAVRPHKGNYAIQEAARCLARGENVCIFPEGALSLDGKIAEFRSGVARLHKASKCPIIPFAIYGGYEAWSVNQRLPRLCKIAIHFGVPLNRLELDAFETRRELQDIVTYIKDSLDRRHSRDNVADYESSLLTLIQSKSDTFSARPALCLKEHSGRWNEVSYAELSRRAARLSSYLIEVGINRGDNIVILSQWRPEFAVCLFGAWRAGATVVSLNINISSATLKKILRECQPKAIFVSRKLIAKIEEIKNSIECLQSCFLLDEQLTGNNKLKHIDALIAKNKLPSVQRDSKEVAVITYTFGTDGDPKGIMTTFQNLIFQARLFELITDTKQGERFIAIPPLNHLLWLSQGLLAVLHAGGTVYCNHNYSASEVATLMQQRQLTGIIAGSAFYESFMIFVEQSILNKDLILKFFWKFFTSLSKSFPATQKLSDKLRYYIFSSIRNRLGGRLKILLHGGEALDNKVAEFFESICMPILSGYGLSEASPVVACNTLVTRRLGSVGKAVAGVEIKICSVNKDTKDTNDPVGEICTRGPHIMKGYYKRDLLTTNAIDKDGWLHTGDLGKIDDDGFLHVIGRLKNQKGEE